MTYHIYDGDVLVDVVVYYVYDYIYMGAMLSVQDLARRENYYHLYDGVV